MAPSLTYGRVALSLAVGLYLRDRSHRPLGTHNGKLCSRHCDRTPLLRGHAGGAEKWESWITGTKFFWLQDYWRSAGLPDADGPGPRHSNHVNRNDRDDM